MAAYELLQELSRLPHRGSTTAREAEAARLLADHLAARGFPPTVEPFRAPRATLYFGPTAAIAVLLVAAWSSWRSPWIGLGLGLLALIPLLGELFGLLSPDFDWLLPGHPSQNVIAERPSAGPPSRTLVISAHYDTQLGTWLFHPRVLPWVRWYFTLTYGLLALVLVGLVLGVIGPTQPFAARLLLPAGVALAASGLVLFGLRFTGGPVNGANDNGSGVAVAVSLFERLARQQPSDLHLILALTGAEEVGERGMKAFLRSRRRRLATERTAFINIDNVGGGILRYLTGEGMIGTLPYDRSLVELARRIALDEGGRLEPWPNLLLPTDALPATRLGYRAITFIGIDAQGRIPNYHWHTDVLERVSPAHLAEVERIIGRYVEVWLAEPAPSPAALSLRP